VALFRQSALDKATSPERLDEAISIVSARSWLLLAGIAMIVAGGLAWGVFGSVSSRATGMAVIFEHGEAVGYFSALQGNRIEPGMTVQVAPRGVARDEFGTINAVVTTVTELPVSREHVTKHLQTDLSDVLFSAGPPVEAELRLELDPATPSGLAWTSRAGPPFLVKTGTLADASVMLDEEAPITLILPALRTLLGQ